MNLIDLIILLIFAFSLYAGWQRGFILGLLDLVRWIGSLLIGLRFYPEVSVWLGKVVKWPDAWLLPVSFLMVAMLASAVIQILSNLLLQQLPGHIHYEKPNRILGLLPGVVNGLVSSAIVVLLMLALPLSDGYYNKVQESRLVNFFGSYSNRLETALVPVFEKAAHRTLTNLTIKPKSDEFIELPFKVTEFRPRPDLEVEMLKLVNKERAKEGLQPLELDTALTRVARQHSADMFRRGYFSHYSPEGNNAAERIRQARIPFWAAGENLAMAPTLTIAHEGLMNSPGHRANILQKRYGRVGIGVLQGSLHRLMITQNFRN